jgi:hypothetical protein
MEGLVCRRDEGEERGGTVIDTYDEPDNAHHCGQRSAVS